MRIAVYVMLLISAAAIAAEDPAVVETAKRTGWDINSVKEFYLKGCDSGRPNEQNICATYGFVEVDMQLNRTYSQLMSELKTKSSKSKLRDTQRVWVTFRDKACEFEADGYKGGRDYPTVVAGCKSGYTEIRIKQLKQFIGCDFNYGCPGVIE